MVEGKITTAPDAESETVLFEYEDTPSRAYMTLTDAVFSARHHPNWVQVDVDKIPPHTTLGVAKYDEDADEVTELSLRQSILDDYGHKR